MTDASNYRLELLNRHNWSSWKDQTLRALQTMNLSDAVERDDVNSDETAIKAMALVTEALDHHHRNFTSHCTTAREVWTTLEGHYEGKAVHVAAGYGRTKTVIHLLKSGANVNAQDSDGQAPLHNACCHGHYTVARILIDAGAEVNLPDREGWTPLHFALARKDNAEKISPTYRKVIDLLLKHGADPYLMSKSGRSCIARIKNSEDRRHVRIKHLLNKIQHCNGDNRTKDLLMSRYLKTTDFFELVKEGDVNIDIFREIITPKVLNFRLIDCGDITPLHRAAGYSHMETAKLFLDSGANVDAVDSLGRIPLHNAAQYGHIEMMDLLVSHGSDVNRQDHIGYSPLHLAAKHNLSFTACLKLIELGADIDVKCNDGQSPYDMAETDDAKEVLRPDKLRHTVEMIPSSSERVVYLDIKTLSRPPEPPSGSQHRADPLMLDSNSEKPLFRNPNHTIKKIILEENQWEYQRVKQKMLEGIRVHVAESGGRYSTYEILSIEKILHAPVWEHYRLMCKRLDQEYGSKNEKLLFHGSNFIENIQRQGFDERYAQRNGMFGAGIYFAEHSSKSNQYTFGWGQGCQKHKDKSCYTCERQMIYAQVALGRSLISKEAMTDCAHAPPGYSSVTGSPESTDNLIYPEYVVYRGDQAYPLFVIKYRIVR